MSKIKKRIVPLCSSFAKTERATQKDTTIGCNHSAMLFLEIWLKREQIFLDSHQVLRAIWSLPNWPHHCLRWPNIALHAGQRMERRAARHRHPRRHAESTCIGGGHGGSCGSTVHRADTFHHLHFKPDTGGKTTSGGRWKERFVPLGSGRNTRADAVINDT